MKAVLMKRLLVLLMFFPGLTLSDPLEIKQIATGVYVHHGEHKDLEPGYGGDICNTGFIIGSKGIAVIDTGGSPKVGAQLRAAIRRVSKLPILYVINTHVHPDHVLGNAAFKQDKPVFVGHAKLAETMAARKEAYLRNQSVWVGPDAAGTEMIPPGLEVETTQEIDLGERILRLTAHPVAHSPADLSVFDTASKTLWTGDLLFVERTPSIDGSIPNWLAVIEQLRTTPAAHFVAGHGTTTKSLAAAFDDESRYLGTLLQDVRAAIRDGRSMEDTIPTAAASEKGKWLLFDAVNRRNVALLYPQLEWE